MNDFLVIDNATGQAEFMALPDAAHLTKIDAAEIETAIAESGRCNSMDYLILDTRPAEDVAAA